MQIQFTPAQRDRFWSLVDNSGGFFACWPWRGYRRPGPRSYGRTSINGRLHPAHRLAWLLTHGAMPDGLYVLHRCDNPPCCNPAHLWLGTHLENIADREAKGRNRPVRGEAVGLAKLTAEQVREIRRRYAAGGTSLSALAREHCVTHRVIGLIVRREMWKHVD